MKDRYPIKGWPLFTATAAALAIAGCGQKSLSTGLAAQKTGKGNEMFMLDVPYGPQKRSASNDLELRAEMECNNSHNSQKDYLRVTVRGLPYFEVDVCGDVQTDTYDGLKLSDAPYNGGKLAVTLTTNDRELHWAVGAEVKK